MIDTGMDAVLIKIAAYGLNPHKHLGKSIKELYDYFLKIVKIYKLKEE